MQTKLEDSGSFPDRTVIYRHLFTPAISDKLLQVLQPSPILPSPPFAVSFVFQDAPFEISAYVFDGVIEQVCNGFRRMSGLVVPTGLRSCWNEMQEAICHEPKLLYAVGDGIASLRGSGLELVAGQAYLTPVSLSILPIEGRLLADTQRRSFAHDAVHFVQPPSTVAQRYYYNTNRQALHAFLRFLSDPGADNRLDAANAKALVRQKQMSMIPSLT